MKAQPAPVTLGDHGRTAPMSTPAARRSGGDGGSGGGSTARVAAAIGGSIVLAAGLIGAAVVFSGNKSDTSRTVATQSAVTGAETATPAATGNAGTTEASSSEPAAGADAPAEASSSSASTTYSQSLYSVEIPSEWVQETSDEPNGRYVESVWRNPAEPNTAILIDAESPAPSVAPIVSAESVRAQTSQSSGYSELAFEPTTLAGLPAARWVFDVPGDRRVDYFTNICDAGIAVLGSTTPSIFGSLAPTFHEAASSVTVPCE
jgi:hypothetical protein